MILFGKFPTGNFGTDTFSLFGDTTGSCGFDFGEGGFIGWGVGWGELEWFGRVEGDGGGGDDYLGSVEG